MKKDVEELILGHTENVRKAANKYYRMVPDDKKRMVREDDLISAGYMALVEAAQKYNPEAGNKFLTYAYQWIDNAIKKELYHYLGSRVLNLEDDHMSEDVEETAAENESDVDISGVLDELEKIGITGTEMDVYCLINGIGTERIKNYHKIAAKLHISELEVRRLHQSAERKIKNLTS